MPEAQPNSFYSRHSLTIMAVCLFLLPLAVLGAIRAKQANKNDVRNWIPKEYEETRIYANFRQQYKFDGDESILLSWDSCNRSNSIIEDLALKLVPPITVSFLNSQDSAERTYSSFDLAKLELEAHFAEQAKQTALQLNRAPDDIKLVYGEWNQLGANHEELLIFDDPKAEGNPQQPNRDRAIARIVRPQLGYFKSVRTGPRAVVEMTRRNQDLDEESAAAQLGGTLFAPAWVLRDGLKLHIDDQQLPLNGSSVDIVDGFVQVDGQDLKHNGKPVAVVGRKLFVESTPIHKYDDQGRAIHPATGESLDDSQLAQIGVELRQSCVVVSLSQLGLDNKKAAIDTLRDIAVNQLRISEDQLRMGGPPVDNIAIDQAGNKSLNTLAGVAIVIGSIVSWFSLRSVKLMLIVLSAGIFSAVLSLAIVFYTGCPVDAILFTMPSLVYVATTSGAIHLSNYYRDVRLEGHPASGAAGAALHHAALPLGLATGTTAVGLATLCYTELIPIANFGLYSSIGVLVSALLLIFYIPAALELWEPDVGKPVAKPLAETETHTHIDESGFWWRVGQLILDRPLPMSAACLAVMVMLGFGLYEARTSVQLMRLLSPRERILQDYAYLESKLGPLVPMEIVLKVPKPTAEDVAGLRFIDRLRLVRDVQHSVELIPQVGSTMSTLTFMEDVDQLVEKNRSRLFGGRAAVEGTVNRQLLRYREQLLSQDFLREIDDKDAGQTYEIWRVSARVSALKNVDYAAFINDLKQRVEPVLAGFLADQGRTGTLENAVAAALPAWMDPRELRDGIHVEYTGVVPLVYKAQHSLMDGLVFGFLTDFALIVIVMMIACRDWSAGLVLLLPSAFPAICVFGGMGWLHTLLQSRGWGELFIDIGYVMAPSVALGVTVDDVVHFMLWFRRGITEGMTRKQAVELAYRGCARAMYQSWGVIGIGLSVFSLSPFMPTRNFGIMMISMLTVALVGNLVMMPAMLSGWGGRIFAWGTLRKENRKRAAMGLQPIVYGQGMPTESGQPNLILIPAADESDVIEPAASPTTVEPVEAVPMTLPLPVVGEGIPEPHLRGNLLRSNFRRKK